MLEGPRILSFLPATDILKLASQNSFLNRLVHEYFDWIPVFEREMEPEMAIILQNAWLRRKYRTAFPKNPVPELGGGAEAEATEVKEAATETKEAAAEATEATETKEATEATEVKEEEKAVTEATAPATATGTAAREAATESAVVVGAEKPAAAADDKTVVNAEKTEKAEKAEAAVGNGERKTGVLNSECVHRTAERRWTPALSCDRCPAPPRPPTCSRHPSPTPRSPPLDPDGLTLADLTLLYRISDRDGWYKDGADNCYYIHVFSLSEGSFEVLHPRLPGKALCF